jgi:hypothetical protein
LPRRLGAGDRNRDVHVLHRVEHTRGGRFAIGVLEVGAVLERYERRHLNAVGGAIEAGDGNVARLQAGRCGAAGEIRFLGTIATGQPANNREPHNED